MSEVYTYNATHLTTVREGSVELKQSAELGAPAEGKVALDDTAGTQAIVGQMDFSVTQSSCTFPLTFRGFVGDPSFGRDEGTERSPDVGASRGISVPVVDLNAMLGFLLIDASDGKRPAETVAERGAWLMASEYVDFADNGRCDFPSDKGMDAADYRGQYAGDVLADMALAATGYNYYVADWGSGPELTFRDDNASTADTCTLRISNVLSDASGVTLNPSKDATLERRYGSVYSKIGYSYSKGTVYRERAATATTYNGERGGTASNSNVKTSAKAAAEADAMLWQHSTPEDFITCTLDAVTSAQVNLIRHGMRIQAKFSHFGPEGYDSFTWFRILSRTVVPIVADGELYKLTVRLSPQEEGPPAGVILQSAFGLLDESGGTLTFPNPVTIGSLLVFCIADRGESLNPPSPNTASGQARWGAGAWTKKPNVTTADGPGGAGNIGDGCAIWYKTADSTEQTGYIGANNAVVGVYEIAGVDITAAATASKDQQTAAATMDIGSLGSPAADSVNIMVGLWFDQRNYNIGSGTTDPEPSYVPRTGWTLDIFKPAYYSWPYLWNSPLMYIAHNIGDGSALTAGGTRSGLLHLDGRWAGAAISLPPL